MSQAKPRKGCLKSPAGSKNNSPVPSPSLGSFYTTYSANASYASFAEACADLQSEATSCRPHFRKCVSFCSEDEGLVEVHVADEWDRTPTEPAGHLSYQDILELKAIQRTLPRAQQLPDLLTGKPASHYLSAVPIGLLPLTDSSSSPNSSTPNTPLPTPVGSPHSSSPSTSSGSSPICGSPHTSPPRSPDFGPSHLHPHSPHITRFPSPLSVSSSPSPESVHKSDPISTTIPSNLPTPPFRPPPNPYSNTNPSNLPTPPQRSPPTPNFFDLSHLAPSSSPTMMKRKPNFAFLPLLDTPPSSEENTPVSAVGSGAGTPRDMQSPSSDYSAMHIVGIGEGQETPTKTISREYPALAEPISVKVSIMSQNDDPSSFSSGSSTSSYASDSDFETTSSGYTSGSPLSRTTSISSAATSVSAHMDAELDAIKSDPSSRQEEALEFFVPQFKKYRPVYEEKAGSKTGSPSDFGWGASALRDPRLTAVSSPSLAPPSPLSLDAPASISYSARTEMRSEVLDGAPAITREEVHSSFHVNADVHAFPLGWEEKERLRREGWSDDSGTSSPTSARSWKRTSCEVNVEDGGRFSMPVMDWEEKERVRREACGSFSSRSSSRTGSRVGSRETSRDSERLGIEQPFATGGEGDFGKRKEKKRNVVEINGVEVDLDDDESDDYDKHEGMVKDDVPAKSRRNVMIINGIETALDGDDEPELVCPSVEQSPSKGVDSTPEMSNQLPPVSVPTSTPPSSSVPSSPMSDLSTPTSSTTITFPKLAATSTSTPTLKSRFSVPTTSSYSPLYSTKSSSPSVSRPFSPSSSSNSPFPNPRLSASSGQLKLSPRLSPSLSPKLSPTVSPSSSPISLSPLKSKVMRCSSGNSSNSGTGNPGSPVWVPSA